MLKNKCLGISFGFLCIGFAINMYSLFAYAEKPLKTLNSGQIIQLKSFKSQYISHRDIFIWLPDNYQPAQTYELLIMHDGNMLFDAKTTWNGQEWGVDEHAAMLTKQKRTRPFIVVGIANGGDFRHSEYFPQKVFNHFRLEEKKRLFALEREKNTPLFAGPVRSDAYLMFIVNELLPFMHKHYRLKKGKQYTHMMGSSMGGLISLYALCEYPNIFGQVASLSTHWPGAMLQSNHVPQALLQYFKQCLPIAGQHRIYFDHGTETLDQFYAPFQRQVDAVMEAKGFTSKDWQTQVFKGADHSENAWRQRLQVPLLFLLKTP